MAEKRDLYRKKTSDLAPSRIYQDEEGRNEDIGQVKVHESVIATIVRKSVASVEGVARLAGSTIIDNIAEIVGSKKLQDRAINVLMDGDAVEIDVKIIAEYGAHLPTVAVAVQHAVKEQVTTITDMNVLKVNVIVQGLEEQEKA